MRAANLFKITKIFLPLYLCSSCILCGFLYLYYRAEYKNILALLKEREKATVTLQLSIIHNSLVHIASDLLFLAQQNEFQTLPAGDEKPNLQAMQREFLMLAINKTLYDQIRFINPQGLEKIRINYNDGKASAVPDNALQNKADRYYFKQGISLPAGHIYLSPLDLNIEQDKVELPFKPMLRFTTPCFNQHEKKLGIIVLNFRARNLLDEIAAAAEKAHSESMLLNSDGYWLLNANPEREWGFMFPEKKDETFGNFFPEAWKRLEREQKGQFETPNGLFTFAKIYPPVEVEKDVFLHRTTLDSSSSRESHIHCGEKEKYYWIVLAYISPANLAKTTQPLTRNFLLFGAALLLFSGLATWFLAASIAGKRDFQAKMMHMAQYDALTGLPNRALFFDRLEAAAAYAQRYQKKVGLLYVDLNKFKAVNDTLGHQAGDELLLAVANILKQSVRKSDTMARLGGDEFAAVLHDLTSAQDLKQVGDKIIALLNAPFNLAAGSVQIGASVGGAIFPDHAATTADLIHLADEAMYASKKMEQSACVIAS